MADMTPTPIEVIKDDGTMDFPDAIRELTNGKKIARLAWKPADDYGLLKDGYLMIYINGKFNKFLVNDGDLLGDDWIILDN